MSNLRRRWASRDKPTTTTPDPEEKKPTHTLKPAAKQRKRFSCQSCVNTCFWFIGCICVMWWLLLFAYNLLPSSIPQYVTEVIAGPMPDPPGVKLKKEGLLVKHPVVFVPGIVTGGLELWEGHECTEGLFRKRLWGGTFGEVYRRPLCWLEHMSLDNQTGLDPPGVRVRPVTGLVAADYFAPGYFVWAVLIANLAQIGYEEKNMYMAAYDWRLSFQNTEVRDQTMSRMKSKIELMVATNGGNKAVITAHSMGVLYFLHFMKWVEAPAPMGGGGGSDWCAKHIKAVMNIGGPFLGVPKAASGLFSAEARDVAVARGIAAGVLDKDLFHIQTLQHIMQMTRTWDSTMSMIPKGGETIWGDLDWSPEEDYAPSRKKHYFAYDDKSNHTETEPLKKAKRYYGRIISFGRDAAEADSAEIQRTEFRGAVKGNRVINYTCYGVWTEYHEMGISGIAAIAEYKVYTAGDIMDLLRFVAPKMMERGSAHFSYGIAEDLDDPKYSHYKYWSNPLETRLPSAPEMEIFSMYGIGIPTERAYIYQQNLVVSECNIPFQFNTSVYEDDEDRCIKAGVITVDGDETVPVISAGFMNAKGWRGKTRFNPSGMKTYIREYKHAPPANLLEGRGTQSGAHVDILGNFALIEDIMRVAAGATGEELGGDTVYSDIFEWSKNIDLAL
ncbi:phospholipid:diacylglycerol acyltransferase 1-like [Andrographis paniculata]|uniref:phospholipid:diacylglycerol acyltransferase 1-like n=1 Tax=Andrographis paniculata TaxID=175694 RepID=UPI0021E85E70|nr:phospholipid:diacylglycerol acyltransferase 1-like [Andrographis paniculata]